MKVVHLCTSDHGGAAQAAIRLHLQLKQAGLESYCFTKFNSGTQIEDHISLMRTKSFSHYVDYTLEHYILKNKFPPNSGYSEDTVLFTSPHALHHVEKNRLINDADIIHLHWTSHFIDYLHFFKAVKKPIVWTLHDMNPFTGGCHYSGDCIRFQSTCAGCPQIQNTTQPDLASTYLAYKGKALHEQTNISIVTPSHWLNQLSSSSKLFHNYEHHHIRNGFNTSTFKVMDQSLNKVKFGIPQDKVNILFAAHSLKLKMKGFDLLIQALRSLPKELFHLTILGKNIGKEELKEFHHLSLGHITNELTMAELYNAADVFVTPSLRDNLPNTIAEALLCGTPVIGFKVGGISEMIQNGVNGFFAEDTTVPALAHTIRRFLSKPDQFDRRFIHDQASELYNIERCANDYIKLYDQMLSINSIPIEFI